MSIPPGVYTSRLTLYIRRLGCLYLPVNIIYTTYSIYILYIRHTLYILYIRHTIYTIHNIYTILLLTVYEKEEYRDSFLIKKTLVETTTTGCRLSVSSLRSKSLKPVVPTGTSPTLPSPKDLDGCHHMSLGTPRCVSIFFVTLEGRTVARGEGSIGTDHVRT